MWKVLARARRRFDRDQRGNVAVIFAVSLVPLIGLLGGAVDLTRQQRHKVELLNAMDAAAIALARRGAADDADADTFVNSYVTTMVSGGDPMLHVGDFDATKIEGGWRVTSHAVMETAFLPVVGIQEMPLSLTTEVMASGGDYEVALALDNTGSMAQRNKIGDLRDASNHLVDVLYSESGADTRVKMGLVPFVTAVNIRGADFDPNWLDASGEGLGSHQLDNFDRPVSRLDIFDALSGGATGPDGLPSEWKGCVEAREDGHDLDDTVPGTDPVTRWTPYLWPDDSDVRGPRPYLYDNSYLRDQTGGNAMARMRNVDKYFTPLRLASFDESQGPNRSCAGPVVELTNNQQRMRDAIDAMKPHPGSGTNIAQGLVWGWRVLSPEAPFTQGAAYEDTGTRKALVLLSDGWNEIGGHYTSYGHLADERLGRNWTASIRQMNENITTVCERVKDKNIRLYMILFQVNDPETQRIFEDCASVNDEGESLYYYAPDGASLTAVFGEIGEDLTSIRISR